MLYLGHRSCQANHACYSKMFADREFFKSLVGFSSGTSIGHSLQHCPLVVVILIPCELVWPGSIPLTFHSAHWCSLNSTCLCLFYKMTLKMLVFHCRHCIWKHRTFSWSCIISNIIIKHARQCFIWFTNTRESLGGDRGVWTSRLLYLLLPPPAPFRSCSLLFVPCPLQNIMKCYEILLVFSRFPPP